MALAEEPAFSLRQILVTINDGKSTWHIVSGSKVWVSAPSFDFMGELVVLFMTTWALSISFFVIKAGH